MHQTHDFRPVMLQILKGARAKLNPNTWGRFTGYNSEGNYKITLYKLLWDESTILKRSQSAFFVTKTEWYLSGLINRLFDSHYYTFCAWHAHVATYAEVVKLIDTAIDELKLELSKI